MVNQVEAQLYIENEIQFRHYFNYSKCYYCCFFNLLSKHYFVVKKNQNYDLYLVSNADLA